MQRNEKRKGFMFYKTFDESLETLPEEEQKTMYRAIVKYGLYRIDPQLSGFCASLWKLIKPALDSSWKNYYNARKGGAPLGNQNARRRVDNGTE